MRREYRLLVVGTAGLAGCSLVLPFDSIGSGGVAAATDAGPGGDAHGADGGDAASGSRWCDQQVPAHLFCADFDGPTTWTGTQSLAGTIVEAADAYRSPPNALLATSAPVRSGDLVALSRWKDFGRAASAVRVAFDVRVEQDGASTLDEASPLVVRLLDPAAPDAASPDYYDLLLSLIHVPADPAHGVLREYGPSASLSVAHLFAAPPRSTWLHVRLDVTLTAPSSATLWITTDADASAPPLLDHQPITPTWRDGLVRVTFGVPYVRGPAGTFQYRLDDVAVDLE